MPAWTIVGTMAALSLFFANDIYLWIFSGFLQNDHIGLATVVINFIAQYINYAASLAFLFLAYQLYEQRRYRTMALIGDTPECPHCRSLMNTRRHRSGTHFRCPDCGHRIAC